MKKAILFIFLLSLSAAYSQKLDGAFQIKAAQYGSDTVSKEQLAKQQIIKIFKNGYWISAFFGDPQKPFYGSGGGIYKTDQDKYIETLKFYSWDSTAVGDVYTFNFKLDGNRYHQEGYVDSEKYPRFLIKEDFEKITSVVPLKNASLEGVWQLQNADWSGTADGSLKDLEQIKIYSYPRFAWAQYNPKTRQFIGAGGGTYQYDGKKLVEHIEYITYDLALSTDYKIAVTKMSNGMMQQVSELHGSKETWKLIK